MHTHETYDNEPTESLSRVSPRVSETTCARPLVTHDGLSRLGKNNVCVLGYDCMCSQHHDSALTPDCPEIYTTTHVLFHRLLRFLQVDSSNFICNKMTEMVHGGPSPSSSPDSELHVSSSSIRPAPDAPVTRWPHLCFIQNGVKV